MAARKNYKKNLTHNVVESWRYRLVLSFLFLLFFVVVVRAAYFQIVNVSFLHSEGDARYLRVQKELPSRGMVMDRHLQPLAISTQSQTITANPKKIYPLRNTSAIANMAKILKLNKRQLIKNIVKNKQRQFMYIKRQVAPQIAQKIRDLHIDSVGFEKTYKRYYPSGPVMSHIVGFVDIDNKGQEGVERVFQKQLDGQAGKTQVLKDLAGRRVEYVERLSQVKDGDDVVLSIDSQIQYLAHRYLQAAVKQHRAAHASLVMLDAKTGEILAMLSIPSFNPNNRKELRPNSFRNRSITDVYEPGSTMKPFVVAMALQDNVVKADTLIDTSPGYLVLNGQRINDTHNYEKMSVTEVIQKSSNVGATKIALKMSAKKLYQQYAELGFGQTNRLKLSGESKGILVKRKQWKPIEHATLSYGYGLSVSTLQLARAYLSLANQGVLLPVSLQKQTQAVEGVRIFSEDVAKQVTQMLEKVVSVKGTAPKAAISGYRVAGKTGTAHLYQDGSYQKDSYLSIFAGYAPVSDPDVVAVVAIHDPRGEDYYGGLVAAPVFSKVVQGALRLRDVIPDALNKQVAL